MLFFSAASALAALLLAPSAATASPSTSALSARQYQDPNSPLLVDSPACTFYRCIVTWKHGSTVNINWINAPKGTVNLVMMTDDNNSVAYQIANVSSPSQPGYCDAGSGLGVVVAGKPCGRYEFVVPTEWTVGRNYSVRAQLIGSESTESFTDVVQLQAADGNPEPSASLSAVAISGAPSSTQGGDVAASETATVTAPISPGASAPSSSSAASGTSSSGSSGKGSSTSATVPGTSGGGPNATGTGSGANSKSNDGSVATANALMTGIMALITASTAGLLM